MDTIFGTRVRNIAVMIGTRPEAIKLMPVIRALEEAGIPYDVIVTGQHRELLTPILQELNIVEAENLDLMEEDQTLGDLSARVLTRMQDLLRQKGTDLLFVQGDTTSVAMGALACFYENVKVAHVEAGLRTFDRRNPFPEEMNRRLVACLADIHFAPTARARENLLAEGVPEDRIHVVGNTVIDALLYSRDHLIGQKALDPSLTEVLSQGRTVVLVTGHRRESLGADLASICEGIRRVATTLAGKIEIIYPVHLNPNVQSGVKQILTHVSGVRLIQPPTYLQFITLMLRSKLIITDSGGVQEEAVTLGIPVLVTRRTCERLEGVEAGVAELVGPDPEKIFASAYTLLTNEAAYCKRAVPTMAFGDGRAAKRIVAILFGGR